MIAGIGTEYRAGSVSLCARRDYFDELLQASTAAIGKSMVHRVLCTSASIP